MDGSIGSSISFITEPIRSWQKEQLGRYTLIARKHATIKSGERERSSQINYT